MEGHTDTDSGAEIGDGVTSINVDGVCDEQLWPYDIDKFTTAPPEQTYIEGKKCRSIAQKKLIQTLQELKIAINEEFPIVFGFNVYSSFSNVEVAKTGLMPMPQKGENLLGGHAVAIVGYDDDKQVYDKKGAFIVRNSWGANWGDNGYFYMPYDFIIDPEMAADFWVINQITVDLSEYADLDCFEMVQEGVTEEPLQKLSSKEPAIEPAKETPINQTTYCTKLNAKRRRKRKYKNQCLGNNESIIK